MGENLVLCSDRLLTPESLHSLQGAEDGGSSGGNSCSDRVGLSTLYEDKEESEAGGEKELLIQTVECRICQEEDSPKDLEIPCSCSGSLKYAHRKCVQRWCDEKGDITCEICHQPYQPGYTAPPPPPPSGETVIDISGGWTAAGTRLDLNDPRLLSMAVRERHLQEADHDDYDDASASGATFCRSAALFLMALLLLRHAFEDDEGDDDEISAFFSLFLLRAASFLVPCFIMAWGISVLQRRRQRQEAAEVAFLLQAGQQRGLHVTIAPRPAPQAEPLAAPNQATTLVSTQPRHAETPRPELV